MVILVLFSFCFLFYLVSSFRVNLVWIRVKVRARVCISCISFHNQDFVFLMKTAIDYCSKWHRLLQMATIVYERENCIGDSLWRKA